MRRFCRLFVVFAIAALALAASAECAPRKVYKVGVRPMSPPFSFLAIKDGVQGVRGYTVDELVMIGKFLNWDFEFVAVDDLAERREKLMAGEIDILAHASEKEATELGAAFIPAGVSLRNHLYVNKSCTSVTCLRDLDEKRMVVIASAPYAPGVHFEGSAIEVSSPLDALTMLDDGVVDVFLAPSERIADYLIESSKLQNVRKKGVVLGETPMGLVTMNGDPDLVDSMRRAVEALEESGNLAVIRDKWFGKPVATLLQRFSREIAVIAAGAGLLFIFIVLWNVSLNRRVRKAAAELRRTEQRFQDIIESSPDMIFLVNEAGTIFHANQRARAFLDFPDEEDVDLGQFMAAADVDEIRAFMTKVYNDGCDKHEFVMQGGEGNPMEVEIAGRLIQGSRQEDVLACLFARNVTERNRMEEDLIQSERLGIIGKMAASVAHEINNPLGIIQANAEDLMFEEDVSKDVKEGLDAIRRNASRAGEITTGLLELASPKPVSLEILNVEDLIRESISLLGPKAKGYQIDVRVENGPLAIRGDNRALQQVLVNLLFNALEAMAPGGRIVVFASQDREADDKTARIVVSDQGKGIPRENLARIFEPFFTSRKKGFGLGLFITRRMVERHGGVIFAESSPGHGASMVVEFPAHQGMEAS